MSVQRSWKFSSRTMPADIFKSGKTYFARESVDWVGRQWSPGSELANSDCLEKIVIFAVFFG